MSTLIQCPGCNQKFNMQGRLPALFTCTKCQQPMDLTSFPGYVPEPAAAPARGSRAAAPERGGGRSASPRRERDDEDDGGRRHHLPVKKSNQGLLMLAIIGGLTVVVVVVVVMTQNKSAEKAAQKTQERVDSLGGPVINEPPPFKYPPGMDPNNPANWVNAKVKKDGTPADPSAPPKEGGKPQGGAPGPGDTKPVGGPGTIQVWSYPEDVTAEEKQKIDKALDTAINDTGPSQREAEALLVTMGRKAVWRLISEFKHIQDTHGYEARKGKISAMIVDRTLRKIDGFMERMTGYKEHVNPESTLEYTNGVAKRWNGWLETGMWKTERKPWDQRVDGTDEPKDKPAPSGR